MNRRLYRSRTDTILGGVASGLAAYLNADPALVRIAWAILVPLTGGAALLAYIVAWIVVPEEPKGLAPIVATYTEASPSGDPPAGAGGTGEGDVSDAPPTDDAGQPAPAWSPPEPIERRNSNAGLIVGIGLVLIGLWFLLREYLPDFDWGLVWPLIIVGVGVLILVSATRNRT
jgi:phage shock protein C